MENEKLTSIEEKYSIKEKLSENDFQAPEFSNDDQNSNHNTSDSLITVKLRNIIINSLYKYRIL